MVFLAECAMELFFFLFFLGSKLYFKILQSLRHALYIEICLGGEAPALHVLHGPEVVQSSVRRTTSSTRLTVALVLLQVSACMMGNDNG